MSIQVNQFDENKAKAEIKKCPQIVREYFKLLQEQSDNWKRLCHTAIGKLKEKGEYVPKGDKC